MSGSNFQWHHDLLFRQLTRSIDGEHHILPIHRSCHDVTHLLHRKLIVQIRSDDTIDPLPIRTRL